MSKPRYVSAKKSATWAIRFLYLDIIGNVIDAAYSIYLLNQVESAIIFSREVQVLPYVDYFYAVISVLTALSSCVGFAFFFDWLQIVYTNVARFNRPMPEGITWTPLGAFLIPVFNIFRPYQIVQKIWQNSSVTPEDQSRSPVIVFFWWLASLYSNRLTSITIQKLFAAKTLQDLSSALKTGIGNDLVDTVCVVLTLVIVTEITRRQRDARQYYREQV